MEKNYEVELIEELPENIPLKKRGTITTKGEWYGHSFGDCIGRVYKDGKAESFFTTDRKKGTTELFDILRKLGKTRTKQRWIHDRETRTLVGCVDHYVMRRVAGHGSGKETVKDNCLDTCNNVKYEYTYEILFVADDEYKRYVYDTVKTNGPYTCGLSSVLESLEDTVREWAEEEENGFWLKDGTVRVKFYDDFGDEIDAEFYSMHELMMCVNSVRIIELKREIVNRAEQTKGEQRWSD